jgi:hypothetical protein
MTYKTTAPPTISAQVGTIISNLEAALITDGEQDVAGAIMPMLVNLENTSNAGELILAGPAILTAVIAAGPKAEQQAINLVSTALVAIMRLYVPAIVPPAA